MLRDIQSKLQSAITRSKGEPCPALPFVVDAGVLEVSERVAIYADTWLPKLIGSFSDDYELLASELGTEVFEEVCERFIREQKPSSYQMYGLGDALPEYLESCGVFRDRPWLGEVARIERAHYQAAYAPAPDPKSLERLATLPAEQVDQAKLILECGVSLFETHWDLLSFWRVGVQPVARLQVPRGLIVYRRGFTATLRRIALPDHVVLRALESGTTLGEFVERFGERAVSKLYAWASQGFLRAI